MFWLNIVPKKSGSRRFNLVYLMIFLKNCYKWYVWARDADKGDFIMPIHPI